MFRRLFAASRVRAGIRTFSAGPTRRLLEYADYETFQVASLKKEAPLFTAKAVVNGAIKNELSLADFRGKYVVLLFYPKDFTFVCPTEIIAFSDRYKEFEALGTQVLAISTDQEYCHLAWTKTPRKEGGLGPMNIPLVADTTKEIAKDYGVLWEEQGIAFRGLFIIDGKGIVRQITMNDLDVGRSVDETLRLIQGFQYAERNPGTVMPCGWTPGQPTIAVSKASEYFEKVN